MSEVSTYELGHEGNHEIEKTNGLDEGETQNGVREELATESRVAGDGVEEGGEDETDTDTSTGQTDGGGTHTQVLGDLDHGLGDLRRVGAAGLESLAGGGVDDLGGLLALDGLESVACTVGSKSMVSQLVRDEWHDGQLRPLPMGAKLFLLCLKQLKLHQARAHRHRDSAAGIKFFTYWSWCAWRQQRAPELAWQVGRPWSPWRRRGGKQQHERRPL
ncbi:hypothetical protein PG990_007018 [Apiospora arundinis]